MIPLSAGFDWRSCLARFAGHDFDPPRVRVGLIVWRSCARRWVIVAAGGGQSSRSTLDERERLRDVGLLLFGDEPWSQAELVVVTGKLAALDEFVSSHAPPGELVLKPRPVVVVDDVRPAASVGAFVPRVEGRSEVRARRGRPRREPGLLPARQGRLL